MRKLSSVIVIVLTAWLLQACDGKAEDDSITKADSINAVSAGKIKPAITVEKADAEFAVDAASGGMTEIALGTLAQQKGLNKRVRNFGMMMAKGHSKTNEKLSALASAKNIALPKVPGADGQKTIDQLSVKAGRAFDKAYIDDMIADHQHDIKEFKKAARNCADPDIKAFAAKMLPVLQTHLDAINAIHDSMK